MEKAVPRSARDSFDHTRLDVYNLSFEFFKDARALAIRLHGIDSVLKLQFMRAALSIQLNIAEGSGELRPKEKGRFYRMARRSADECSALLDDIAWVLKLRPADLEPLFVKLRRMITMLIQLDRKMQLRFEADKAKKARRKPQT